MLFYFCNLTEQAKATEQTEDRVKRSPYVPKFIGKRDDNSEDALQKLEAAIRAELLNQEAYDTFPSDEDDAFERVARLNRQLFVGKRDSNPLGKRLFLSPQVELKRSTLLFPDSAEIPELNADKRAKHPIFVGKRRAPYFIGKRRMHLVVGRGGNMNAPKLVGKRGTPLFVGRRRADTEETPTYFSYIALRRSVPEDPLLRISPADSLLKRYNINSAADILSKGKSVPLEYELLNSSNFKSKRFETPVFIGKRKGSEDLASVKQAHNHILRKRFEPPMFVGRRSEQQTQLQKAHNNQQVPLP
jgi:hypothetical protein